jgi:putative acetyltransferase
MIIVAETDPREPATTALLQQSHALMEELFPPEDNFYLDIGDLVSPDIKFYTARENGTVLGTGAVALKPDYAEVKSMFVAESARGKGVAGAILRQLEDTARDANAQIMKLETGDVLHAAHKLYESHGFIRCDVFEPYNAAGSSIFMEKPLT